MVVNHMPRDQKTRCRRHKTDTSRHRTPCLYRFFPLNEHIDPSMPPTPRFPLTTWPEDIHSRVFSNKDAISNREGSSLFPFPSKRSPARPRSCFCLWCRSLPPPYRRRRRHNRNSSNRKHSADFHQAVKKAVGLCFALRIYGQNSLSSSPLPSSFPRLHRWR